MWGWTDLSSIPVFVSLELAGPPDSHGQAVVPVFLDPEDLLQRSRECGLSASPSYARRRPPHVRVLRLDQLLEASDTPIGSSSSSSSSPSSLLRGRRWTPVPPKDGVDAVARFRCGGVKKARLRSPRLDE
eukprot:GHVU01204980.1.p2 GENE.GHVU01204980.1~~GHVU01204980.1.p2  ORF type:complete len:130 (-),score=21.45 GHVU01204980.1:74-463(-)